MTGRRIALFSGILAAILLALFLFEPFLSGSGRDRDGWKGYQVLLCPETEAVEKNIPQALRELGLSSVVSLETITVRVADFAAGREIPLSEADTYFFEGDPRRDPFITALPALFRQGGYRIYYLKDTLPPAAVKKRLAALPISGWIFPSFRFRFSLAGILILLLCGLLHFLFAGRNRLAMALGMIPGAAAAATGSDYKTLAGFVLLYAAFQLAPQGLKRALARRDPLLIPAAGGLILGSILILYGGGLLAGALLIAAEAALHLSTRIFPEREILPVTVRFRNPKVTEHPVFEPVFIGRRPPRKALRFNPGSWAFIGIPVLPLLLLGVLSLSFLEPREGGIPPYPVPVGSPQPLTPEGITRYRSESVGRQLPDVSEYLFHRFYQDWLLYGAEWGFPFIKNAVSISTFSETDGRIIKTQGTLDVKTLNEWSRYLQDLENDPLFDLFYRQGGVTGVALAAGTGAAGSMFRWWDFLAFLLLSIFSGVPYLLQLFSGKGYEMIGRFAAAWRKS